MIERVAREIARATALDDGKAPDTADDFTDAVWEDFVPAARAVVIAMREPTGPMIAASASDGGRMWRIMIDAALAVKGYHGRQIACPSPASA